MYYLEQDIVDMGPALSRHCEEPFCGDEAIPFFLCTLHDLQDTSLAAAFIQSILLSRQKAPFDHKTYRRIYELLDLVLGYPAFIPASEHPFVALICQLR